EVVLYINGDLIDRGIDSADMLLDVKKRMISNPFKIVYLGGNHELMMYQTYIDRIKGLDTSKSIWYFNGGWMTDRCLEETLDTKEKDLEMVDFISNLKIVHTFDEKINGKNIMLVHAAYPPISNDYEKLRIKDNNAFVNYMVWTREKDCSVPITDNNYFTIVGHTPNKNMYGCEYHSDSNYLNIDGGCARYVTGNFSQNHSPLIEVCEGYLKVLTFNNDNDIIYGNYFSDKTFTLFNDNELNNERKYLNNSFKPRKLTFLKDDSIGYE
ncbi:MAG: metallophosphoesterase, partial [Clostridia bacterium]|nr:metallophosphoesterase [Clostridia bacterium]